MIRLKTYRNFEELKKDFDNVKVVIRHVRQPVSAGKIAPADVLCTRT